MSDLPKYLPLSQRPRRDESGVTNNWAPQLAVATTRLTELLDTLEAPVWAAPSSRPAVTVGDVANEALTRLTAARWRLLTRRPSPALPREQVSSALVRAAARARATVRDLSAVVVAGYDIAAATGAALTVDPIASGAVALALGASASTAVRSVTRDHTFAAIDAEWQVGAGPRVEATASAIVLFLAGRGAVPVQATGG